MKILVTGATGYIGGRLIPELLEKGCEVSVFVRDPHRLQGRKWAPNVKILKGDLERIEDIEKALENIEAAYFLVHSMSEGADYAEKEKKIAENFSRAAKNLEKIIYLGGLQPQGAENSEHLKSRAAVGEILRQHGNATEFRAGPIVGSGSASFEMVRYLTERLPIMITPKWIKNEVQPIAIRDVISYLVGALERKPLGVVDIGADVLPFRRMMEVFAEVRGLKRLIVSVPFFTPTLSGLWVGLITPIPNSLAVPLIKGIINPVLADTTKAEKYFPEIKPIPYREAVRLALEKIRKNLIETRWSGALGSYSSYTLTDKEGLLKEVRTVMTDASPHSLYRSFTSIGGTTGWLTWNWAWRLRGFFDKLVGGPGLTRGRRDPYNLQVGETLDFWRVEALEEDKMMLLRAEMIVPGKAWLQFEIIPKGSQSQLVQTALYAPKGLFGMIYWYAMYPAHLFLFGSMARNVALGAEILDKNSAGEKMPSTV